MWLVSSRDASVFALRLRARWLSSGLADSQPVASDTRNHMMLLTCERMLLCECMCTLLARLACVQRAYRVCCARVCSCARRRAASVGEACEAKPGARHAELRFVQLFTARHKTRSEHTQKANAIARSLHFYLAGILPLYSATCVRRAFYQVEMYRVESY